MNQRGIQSIIGIFILALLAAAAWYFGIDHHPADEEQFSPKVQGRDTGDGTMTNVVAPVEEEGETALDASDTNTSDDAADDDVGILGVSADAQRTMCSGVTPEKQAPYLYMLYACEESPAYYVKVPDTDVVADLPSSVYDAAGTFITYCGGYRAYESDEQQQLEVELCAEYPYDRCTNISDQCIFE